MEPPGKMPGKTLLREVNFPKKEFKKGKGSKILPSLEGKWKWKECWNN